MEKFKINLEYFKLPKPKLINSLALAKYDFMSIELTSKTPCIYLSPRTADIDTNLITKCIKDKFVFLKTEVISKISNGLMKEKETKKLLSEIEKLSKERYSISMLYGSSPTIFGENEPLPENLIMFLRKINLDIRFLTFPGEYFAFPIWADKPIRQRN